MNKKIVVHYRNGYGLNFNRKFESAADYLDWKQSQDSENWNTRNEIYLELIKVTTQWLPLDWRGVL
ncbi:hypothetical protein J1P26_22130 [Neobacillus sp. MM2021_6]|uniref:hypothetical protein n=1 Tax=Bacillaceae TaxID=186817 RepID=UPI001408D378|nr:MULTISPECIES: hypothetical protein [Bacillaceae]MBO0962404.1 hypothetical protein [Neobacillus sp. MM2021_6]NHC21027.1 hypothetical protein [Bacillus sp. MM2020_4]